MPLIKVPMVKTGKSVLFACVMATLSLVVMVSCSTKKEKPMMKVTPRPTHCKVPTDRVVKKILPNGMTILAMQDKSIPQVLVQIAYDIGSAVEQSYERGLAHLIEHMIFKGTQKLSEGDIDAIARKYGADFNAFTSFDYTGYYFQTDNANWRHFVNILFDCMKNARFDEQHLASELRAVVQELNMYKDKYGRAMQDKALSQAFPANHPYHFPIIGFKEELANLTAQDLRNFYHKYYHPERATLFLVGDIDLDKDVDFAAKTFSQLPASKSAARNGFPLLIAETEVHHSTVFHEVQVPWACMHWKIPGLPEDGNATADLVNFILGSQSGSRLSRRLIDELKIANAVETSAFVMQYAGLFFIFFSPKDGKTQECYAEIKNILAEMAKTPVAQEELQRAISSEVSKFLWSLEDSQDLVHHWMDSFFATRDEFDVFKFPEKIAQNTPETIRQYIQNWLNPMFASTVELLPLSAEMQPVWSKANAATKQQENLILEKHQRTAEIEEAKFVHTLPPAKEIDFVFPPPTTRFTLSNGINVLVHEKHELPLVSFRVAFKNREYYAKSLQGFAADLMISLLIENSENATKQQNEDNLALLGASYGVNIADGGYFDVTAANFAETLKVMWNVLTKPKFSDFDLAKLQEIKISEIMQAKDSPAKRASNVLKQTLYEGTEYAWDFDTAIDTMKSIKLAQILEMHTKIVRPEEMVISVAGDVDVQALKQQLEELMGSWQHQSTTPWQEVVLPTPKLNLTLQKNIDMLRDQAVLLFGRGSEVDVYHPDAVPLLLLSKIVFSSLGSRIYQLRERSGLFYTANGGFASAIGKSKGNDYIITILNPENVAGTRKLIEQMLAKVAQDGIVEEELTAAKQMYLQDLIQAAGSTESLAQLIAGLDILHLPDNYYQQCWERVRKTTVADLNALAKKYCNLDGMAVIVAGGKA